MQGFNRYIPPDYDPKQNSTLNGHQGKKHALGARAKDIDKGILIVRFELPFNIWCGSCGAHIGAGVRYNAQKKKVGAYYSTPIYGFRCKCHLCSGWFEIRTDPKNAAYEVHEGAKKKDEDWNPLENGGFATHDTEAPSAADPPTDPLAHLEKTIDQATWAKRNTSRVSELSDLSDRLSSDPYVVSSALRRRFREDKKIALEKQGRDDGLRDRYGLHDEVDLGVEDVERGKEMWEAGRERKGLPLDAGSNVGEGSSDRGAGGSSTRAIKGTPASTKGKGRADITTTPTPDLASLLRKTTARKYDPFSDSLDNLFSGSASPTLPVRVKTRLKEAPAKIPEPETKVNDPPPRPLGTGMAVLAGYESD